MPNFPDFFDVLPRLGRRGAFYQAIVEIAGGARDGGWSWAEVDDLQEALLMGGPLDNMAVNHES